MINYLLLLLITFSTCYSFPIKFVSLQDKLNHTCKECFYYELDNVYEIVNNIHLLTNSSVNNYYTLEKHYIDNNYYIPHVILGNKNIDNKKNVLFNGNIHAREVITINIQLFTIKKLLEEYTKYLDKYNVHIIITSNPRGYFIDNAYTLYSNDRNTYFNVPGIHYRKNGSNFTFPYITRPLSECKLFESECVMGDFDYKTIGSRYNNTANFLMPQYNYGVDLNRNFGRIVYNNNVYTSELYKNDNLFNSKYLASKNVSKKIIKDIKKKNKKDKIIDYYVNNNVWGCCKGSSNDIYDSTYRGIFQNSEKESIILQKLFFEYKYNFVIDHHSYGNAIVLSSPFNKNYMVDIYNNDIDKIKNITTKILSYNNTIYKIDDGTVINYTIDGDFITWTVLANKLVNKNKNFIAFVVETGKDEFYPSFDESYELTNEGVKLNLNVLKYYYDNF